MEDVNPEHKIIYIIDIIQKKYNPPYSKTHQLFVWALTPSSEPSSYLSRAGMVV
jgi:hypothetical protein